MNLTEDLRLLLFIHFSFGQAITTSQPGWLLLLSKTYRRFIHILLHLDRAFMFIAV